MQTSALDVQQQRYLQQKAREREVRVAGLWRWLLTQKMGREFLWDVLLADVRYDRPIRLTPKERPSPGDAALYNLGVQWLNTQVRRHRDLYLQMLAEASKREDEERQRDEARASEWAREEGTDDD